MKYVSVSEMVAIEREANENGLSYTEMMENAGEGLAEVILEVYGFLEERSALGLVGSGNNGGDTLVALEYLAQEDWQVSALIVRPRAQDDPLMMRLEAAGGEIFHLNEKFKQETLHKLLSEHAVLMDGILGTGIHLPLKGELAGLMETIRIQIQEINNPPVIVAVDCPSGIDCDSGESARQCIPADITVTMAAIKQGLLKLPAFELLGDIHVVPIGLPENGEGLKSWRDVYSFVPDINWVAQELPERPLNAHKGTFGTALVIAGSTNYTGAALLAGKAAYRIGAGLVTLAIPSPLHMSLAGHFPEATWLLLPHEIGVIADKAADIICKNLERVSALLVGPGFGLEDTTAEFIKRLFLSTRPKQNASMGFLGNKKPDSQPTSFNMPPLVIDADGLKLLTRLPNWAKSLPGPAVLTPHPGEMSILTGQKVDEIQADRIGVARRWSREWGHVVVLKGAFTVIAAPDGKTAVIPVASPALARAGSGDVLAGLIVGLRAQGLDAFPAAVAGTWIHAYAGLIAADDLGNTASVLAGDILDAVIDVISDLDY
jgi:NAD(P)H-hydrate epimerase